jgi:ABC-2 type transport system permease protein
MNALIRSELLKLRTARSLVLMLAATAAVGVIQMGRLLRSVGSTGGLHPGTQDAWSQLLGGAMGGTQVVLLIGVLASTTEFRHAGLTGTLLVTPDRNRVMLAKLIACALLGAATAVTLLATGAVAGLVTGTLTGPPGPAVLRAVAGGVALTAFWGWAGAGIGLLIRHQVLALAVPLVWLLVVETLVTSFGLGALRWWLPGGAGAGLTGAPGALPAGLAALLLTGYGIALTVPALRRLGTSDIT